MKIGYPCINTSINCTSNSTFRLKNYSKESLKEKLESNLNCLEKTLKFNVEKNILFFRIGSGLVPFASHEICQFNWLKEFKLKFKKIGNYIKKNEIRISMHPDQFVVLNALDKKIVRKSIKEINYHCSVLDLMELNSQAKVQIHVGGVYHDKQRSITRFIKNYLELKPEIKKRLVLENDHLSYSLKDCLLINKQTDIPIVFDVYHHQCFNNKETINQAVKQAAETWQKKDGVLMIDYSEKKLGKRKGVHAEKINLEKFKIFLEQTENLDFDLILELKNKEKEALKTVKFVETYFPKRLIRLKASA
jgi:UV DNA damage endonuclease